MPYATTIKNRKVKMFSLLSREKVCVGACSCVTADTLILMHDFRKKRAGDIVAGDVVFSPYAATQSAVVEQVVASRTIEHLMVLLGFDGFEVEATPNHVFVLPDFTLRTAANLKIGDKVVGVNNQEFELKNTDTTSYSGDLINFIINEKSTSGLQHVVVNENVYSGDYIVQSLNDAGKIRFPLNVTDLQLND